MLTDLLDLKALAQVLYKKDDNSAEIVRTEMAEDHLKTFSLEVTSIYRRLSKNCWSLAAV